MPNRLCRVLIVDDDIEVARRNAGICIKLNRNGSIGKDLTLDVSISNNAYFVKDRLDRFARQEIQECWDVIIADVFMPEPTRKPKAQPESSVELDSVNFEGVGVTRFLYNYTHNSDIPTTIHGGFLIAAALDALRSSVNGNKFRSMRLALVSGQLAGRERRTLLNWTKAQDRWCAYYDKADWEGTSNQSLLAPHLYESAIRNAIVDWATPHHWTEASDARLRGVMFGNSTPLQTASIQLRRLFDLNGCRWFVIAGLAGSGRETLLRSIAGDGVQVKTLSARDLSPARWHSGSGVTVLRDLNHLSPQVFSEIEASFADLSSGGRVAFVCDERLPAFLEAAPERIVRLTGLQDRPGDISAIALGYADLSGAGAAFTQDAIAWLEAQEWTGQVAEMKSLVLTAVSHTYSKTIDVEILKSASDQLGKSGKLVCDVPAAKRGPKADVEGALTACVKLALAFRAIDSTGAAAPDGFADAMKSRLASTINDDQFVHEGLNIGYDGASAKRCLQGRMHIAKQNRSYWKKLSPQAEFLAPILSPISAAADWETRITSAINECLTTLEERGYRAKKRSSGT